MRGQFIKIVAAIAAVAPLASVANAEDRDCARCGDGYSGYHSWQGPHVIDVRRPDANAQPASVQPDRYVRRHLVQTMPTELLDPSDARPPVYIVNQGGLRFGVPYFAVPTYSEGGYAYVGAYPYGAGYYYGHYRPYRALGDAVYQLGYRPYSSYGYHVPPSARVIQIAPASQRNTPAR
jgi:hypothetical protein